MVHRMDDSEQGRRGLRQRLFAAMYRRSMSDDRLGEVVAHKQRLLPPLRGTVVEFGPGTGANFEYLTPGEVRWIGVEPNVFMHQALLEAAAARGIVGELRTASAEASGLPNACADAVISTHVFCSVTNVESAYAESLRLLKPGGVFCFVEHVAGRPGSATYRWQRLIRPAWQFAADGCHPDRDLEAAIRAAGFSSLEVMPFRIAAPIVSPHIAGRAWK